ncbi:MAG: ABC transporter permease, partial [Acetobacteraceae bacterium]
GAPAGSTRVMAIAAYHAAYEQYDYSMGSAIAMIMAFVQVVIVVLILKAQSRLYRGPASGGKG